MSGELERVADGKYSLRAGKKEKRGKGWGSSGGHRIRFSGFGGNYEECCLRGV